MGLNFQRGGPPRFKNDRKKNEEPQVKEELDIPDNSHKDLRDLINQERDRDDGDEQRPAHQNREKKGGQKQFREKRRDNFEYRQKNDVGYPGEEYDYPSEKVHYDGGEYKRERVHHDGGEYKRERVHYDVGEYKREKLHHDGGDYKPRDKKPYNNR